MLIEKQIVLVENNVSLFLQKALLNRILFFLTLQLGFQEADKMLVISEILHCIRSVYVLCLAYEYLDQYGLLEVIFAQEREKRDRKRQNNDGIHNAEAIRLYLKQSVNI